MKCSKQNEFYARAVVALMAAIVVLGCCTGCKPCDKDSNEYQRIFCYAR